MKRILTKVVLAVSLMAVPAVALAASPAARAAVAHCCGWAHALGARATARS